MDDRPNPYRTPEALVEPPAGVAPPHDVRALVVAQLALIPLIFLIPETLPADLRRISEQRAVELFNRLGAFLPAAFARERPS